MSDEKTAAALIKVTSVLAAKPNQTLRGFVLGMQDAERPTEVVKYATPKPVEVSDEQRLALSRLAELVSAIEWPDSRKQLTDEQRKQFGDAVVAAKAVAGLAKKVEEGLRTALFNDLDLVQDAAGTVPANAARDKDGHYLTEGEGIGWKRGVTPATPSLDAKELAGLVEGGQLTHKEYLGMTTQIRIADPGKVLAYIRKNPTKFGMLRKALGVAKRGSVSLNLAK